MNIDLDNKTIEKLQAVAAMQNTSVPDLLRVYADEQEIYWKERKEDTERLENIRKTGGIPHNEMMSWLKDLSAGKDV